MPVEEIRLTIATSAIFFQEDNRKGRLIATPINAPKGKRSRQTKNSLQNVPVVLIISDSASRIRLNFFREAPGMRNRPNSRSLSLTIRENTSASTPHVVIHNKPSVRT